jgi:aminopeptidase N
LQVLYYFNKKYTGKIEATLGRTQEMITFLAKRLGHPYPWDKYAQVFLANFDGGMENTSASSLSDSFVKNDENTSLDKNYDFIIVHEIFHQWFGDLVTCKNWAELYINEGFANYSDNLWVEYKYGKDESLHNLINYSIPMYLNETRTKWIRPIRYYGFDYPGLMFDRHIYEKGSVVVHMLRFELGDKLFFKVISEFLKDFQFKSVDTEDLISTIEKVTGRNMKWFFDQWIDRPGHPVLDITYEWNDAAKEITLNVQQKPDTASNVPIFKFSTLIEFVTEAGKKLEKISVSKKEESFTFSLESKPIMVRFDKGLNLLKEAFFQKTEEELIYQLMYDDDVSGRFIALNNLKEQKTGSVKEALIYVVKNDPFWAMRKDAVILLSSFQDSDVVETLKTATKDKNEKVRREAIRALGNFSLLPVVLPNIPI